MNESASQLENRDKEWFPWIDGLRAFAWLCVVCTHTGIAEYHNFGPFGVSLFFAVSGLLITRIMLKTLASRDFLVKFYARRWTRIAPPYYFALSLYLFLFLLPVPQSRQNLLHAVDLLPDYLTFTAGFFREVKGPFGIAWSIAVEEVFYLIAPLVFFLIKNPRGLKWMLLILLGLDYVAGLHIEHLYLKVPPALICGCIAGLIDRHAGILRIVGAYLPVLLIAGIGGLVFGHDVMPYGLPVGALLGLLVLLCSGWQTCPPSVKPVALIGRFSYELYLLHVPFAALGFRLCNAAGIPFLAPLLAAILTMPLALAVYFLLSRKFLVLRVKIDREIRFARILACLQLLPIPLGFAYHFLVDPGR